MRIHLDDDSASRRLSDLLRNAGHDVSTPTELGISGAPDPMHLIQAIRDDGVLLTRNARDFGLLHTLVLTSGGGHPGILVLRFANDPTRDLSPGGATTAIAKLISSGVRIANEIHVLNHWR